MANNKLKTNAKETLEAFKGVGFLSAGVIGGSLAGGLLDKVTKVDETDSLPKRLIKPLVLITAGASGAALLKNESLKLVSSGVSASGVLSGVKVFLKRDMLEGLNGEFGNTLSNLNDFVSVEPYNPNLPILEEHNLEQIPIESSNLSFDDYEEVDEVEFL
jgi:hypothetical protein